MNVRRLGWNFSSVRYYVGSKPLAVIDPSIPSNIKKPPHNNVPSSFP